IESKQQASQYSNTRLLIAGEWCDATDNRTQAVVNPTTGKQIGHVAHASTKDLDRALKAAAHGFDIWKATPAVERSRIMRRAAVLLRERVEYIATLMTLEQGKPLVESRIETLAGADIIEWFADEGMPVFGRVVPSRSSPNLR